MRQLGSSVGMAALFATLVAVEAWGGSVGLAIGGYVPAARTLEVSTVVIPASPIGSKGGLDVVIAAPGNGNAGYALILRGDGTGHDVVFDGWTVDLGTGQARLAEIGATPGRGPEYRLRVRPATGSGKSPGGGGYLRLVLRSN